MGVFDLFRGRRKRERAIPDPESAEFEQAVAGSELPGSTGAGGDVADWKSVIEQGPSQTIDLRGTGAREEIVELLEKHGIDAESGEQVDATEVEGLQKEILEVLKRRGFTPPG